MLYLNCNIWADAHNCVYFMEALRVREGEWSHRVSDDGLYEAGSFVSPFVHTSRGAGMDSRRSIITFRSQLSMCLTNQNVTRCIRVSGVSSAVQYFLGTYHQLIASSTFCS